MRTLTTLSSVLCIIMLLLVPNGEQSLFIKSGGEVWVESSLLVQENLTVVGSISSPTINSLRSRVNTLDAQPKIARLFRNLEYSIVPIDFTTLSHSYPFIQWKEDFILFADESYTFDFETLQAKNSSSKYPALNLYYPAFCHIGTKMYTFGGQDAVFHNTFQYFDFEQYIWSTDGLNQTNLPSIRSAMGFACDEREFYIDGGSFIPDVRNDTFRYSFKKNEWEYLGSEHYLFGSFAAVWRGTTSSEDRFVVVGGTQQFTPRIVSNTIREYSIATSTWNDYTGSGTPMTARGQGSSLVYNGDLYICGGQDVNDTPMKELFRVTTTGMGQYEWSLLTTLPSDFSSFHANIGVYENIWFLLGYDQFYMVVI